MNKHYSRIATLGLIIFYSTCGFMAPASAQDQNDKPSTVRREIGKPLQAALVLLKSEKAKAALAKIAEADAVKDKTPFETYMVGRLRAQSEAVAGDAAAAAHDFEVIADFSGTPSAERMQYLDAAVGQYYLAKNYAKAAETASRYLKSGGSDKTAKTVYVQSLYLTRDFKHAAEELLAYIKEEESSGQIPEESQLQMLAYCYQKMDDKAAYSQALEKLVSYYPKHDYWMSLIYNATTQPGFPNRLSLDADRLKLATKTMNGADDYVEAVQLALQAGFPLEAKELVDAGYTAGVLGTGPDSARHKRLKDMTMKELADDNKSQGQNDSQIGDTASGFALLNTGFNFVLHGKNDRGLNMMEKALQHSNLKHLDDAQLLFGYALYLSHKSQRAIQVFKGLHGNDSDAVLARLWVLHLSQRS